MAEALPDDGLIRVDTDAHRVWLGAREVHLAPMRYRLLAALYAHAGKVVPHEALERQVWGTTWRCDSALKMQACHLRRSLGDAPDGGQYIATVQRVGYRLEAQWAGTLVQADTVTVARADLQQALEHLEFSHAVLADGDGEYSPAYRTRLRAALEEGADGTRVLIARAAIECVLLDHVDELDDACGRVDANLAELAYVYRELTGWDAKTEARRG